MNFRLDYKNVFQIKMSRTVSTSYAQYNEIILITQICYVDLA